MRREIRRQGSRFAAKDRSTLTIATRATYPALMPTLEFKGKQHIYAHHLTVPYSPLVVDPQRSHPPAAHAADTDLVPDDNLIIHGDNLRALKALLPRYAGKVNCIYIDPPYNTGNEGWSYNDNANSPLMQQWLKDNGPVDDEDLERHDKWLCMMWPRLQLLRELLADDGVIFISIDDNEQHHLRMLLDEIFGEGNFFATLARRAMHTVRNSSKDFNANTDFVHVYALNKAWWSDDKNRYIRVVGDKSAQYPYDDGDGRGRYKLDPIHARNYYEPYEHTFDSGTVWRAPSGTYPRYSPDTLTQMERDGRLNFTGREPRAKRYLSDVQEGQPPDTFLSADVVRFNATGTTLLSTIMGEGGTFTQPKPIELIQHLLDIIRKPDAVVLDSFAGSGTTGHAVISQNRVDGGNRRFILIECEPDYADTVTAERVRRVIVGVPEAKDEALRDGLGGSFTYCTLGDPFDAESLLSGEGLPDYETLAIFLLHTAAGLSLEPDALRTARNDQRFYRTETTDYYLYFEPDIEWLKSDAAMLTPERAKQIQAVGKPATVFGAGKYLGQRELTDMGITFCQLPYELFKGG